MIELVVLIWSNPSLSFLQFYSWIKKKNAGNETFENLGTIGTLSNLMVYLTTVFNMKSVIAATIVNIFNGTSNMTPLLGAFLSYSYFGQYKTLAFAAMSSLLVTPSPFLPNIEIYIYIYIHIYIIIIKKLSPVVMGGKAFGLILALSLE